MEQATAPTTMKRMTFGIAGRYSVTLDCADDLRATEIITLESWLDAAIVRVQNRERWKRPMPSDLVRAAANDYPPFAFLWRYRTLHAEGISRNRLLGSLDFERWQRCRCCGRAMRLMLREGLP